VLGGFLHVADFLVGRGRYIGLKSVKVPAEKVVFAQGVRVLKKELTDFVNIFNYITINILMN
jgi:hypothetical protein